MFCFVYQIQKLLLDIRKCLDQKALLRSFDSLDEPLNQHLHLREELSWSFRCSLLVDFLDDCQRRIRGVI
jgi:hypothetical protein